LTSNGKTAHAASKERNGAMLDRLEVKYFVDRSTRTALTRDLLAFMRPDVHAGNDGSYLVRSLYFDTPEYQAYHEKLSGAATRNKLRARTYGEASDPNTPVRMEVKGRFLSYIKKLTRDLSQEEYRAVETALRRRTLPPEYLLGSDSTIKEFFRLQRQYNMEPKILIQYRRQAFERMEINRARVNFDDELLASRNLDLLGPLAGARRLLRYGSAILEIKVDGYLPDWLHMLIVKYSLQAQAISKYCHAVRSEARLSAFGRADDA